MSTRGIVAQGTRRGRSSLWFPFALLILYVGQCLWFTSTQSFTCDEPNHIRAGLEAVRNGRFVANDQPPLARLLFGLVLRDSKWQIGLTEFPGGAIVRWMQPGPEAIAWRARLPNVALGVALGILLWSAARSFFSQAAANVILALFVFSAEAIAHFSLATTDGVGTLMVFAAAIQTVNWRRNPSGTRSLLLGGVLGALLLAKFYTTPLFVVSVALAFLACLRSEHVGDRRNKLRNVGVIIIGAFLTAWCGYLFHVSVLSIHDGKLITTFPNREIVVRNYPNHSNLNLYIPAGEYFEGLREVTLHNHRGHRAFFLGTVSPNGGWKLYFPVAMLLKWPPIVLMISLTVAWLALRRRIGLPHDLVLLAVFPGVFLIFAVLSKINIGVRHILPIYPFVLLFCAAIWEVVRKKQAWRWVLYAAIVLNAADCLRYAPDYLSYFTPFVRPTRSYRLLADSNLDWGQGLLALRKYESQHPREEIHFSYFGCVDPAIYGIRSQPLGEKQRVSGIVVVGASQLAGPFLNDPQAFHWLLQYPVIAVLDHSLYVFRVAGAEK